MGGLGPGDIHSALTQGPGTSSFQDARAASTSLAQSHQDRENQALALVMKMGAAWTGDASEAARAGAAPLLQAFRDGQQALSTHQDLMGRQTDSFGVAKTSVHDVPNEPPSASFGDMVSDVSGVSVFTGGGYLNKLQDWSDKANANVAAYGSYANASTYNQSNMPHEYGDPSGSASDVAVAQQQPGPGGHGPGGTGEISGPGGTGSTTHPASHYSGGPGPSAWTPSDVGNPGPGTGGLPSPGGTPGYGSGPTNTQGWPGAPSAPGTGAGGWPTPGSGGQGWGSGGASGGFPGTGGVPFGMPGGGGFDGGTAGGGTGGGGARGLRAGGMAGTGAGGAAAAESQTGPGARAGAGGPGGSGPGAAMAAGRPGAPGAPGAGGMAGGGRGGRKEEDQEHTSAAYLEDDYSDELIGELPRTAPTVIGLD
ncbi:PPE family protein [Kutzneria sp. CA-103260]|nr:PPE family protein [Kutzneria sp. CA-103260]